VTVTAGIALGALAVVLVTEGATVVVGAVVVVVATVVVGASVVLGASVVFGASVDDVEARTKWCRRWGYCHHAVEPASRSAMHARVAVTAFATSLRRRRRCARAILSRSDLDVIRVAFHAVPVTS